MIQARSSLLIFLGYVDSNKLILHYKGTLVAARDAIRGANNKKVGVGLYAGHLRSEVYGDRVRICYFAPQTRSWCGPIFNGDIESGPNTEILLKGFFRLTYVEMTSIALFQCGIIFWVFQYIVEKSHPRIIYYSINTLLYITVLLVGLLGPRLSWLTRRWKTNAIRTFLADQGFRPS